MKNKTPEKISPFGYTYIGRRSNNEDNYEILQLSNDSFFLAVADGMGGYEGGEIASQLAMEAILEILHHLTEQDLTIDNSKNILKEVFLTADKKISAAKKQWPKLSSMGTTLTCLLILGERYVWGNLGDSRIYLINKNHIRLITKDHTYLEQYRSNKANNLPSKIKEQYGNTLTKALDGNREKPDIYPYPESSMRLMPGQAFLLCSDGLITNDIESNPRPLLQLIRKTPDLKTASHIMVDQAYANGSKDNITVVLAEYGHIARKKIHRLSQLYPSKNNRPPKSRLKDLFHPKQRSTYLWIAIILLLTSAGLWIYQQNHLIRNNPVTQNENQNIPVKKPPGDRTKLEDIIWDHALEDYNNPLKKTDPISWHAFPEKNILLRYRVEILMDDDVIGTLETEKTYARLNQLGVKQVGNYTLRLKAITRVGVKMANEVQLNIIR